MSKEIIEELITYPTAKLAKEKGFDWECLFLLSPKYHSEKPLECEWENWNKTPHLISLPTQSLLQKWLREKHGILAYVNPRRLHVFEYNIVTSDDHIIGSERLTNWEEVLEKGLQEALKLIK